MLLLPCHYPGGRREAPLVVPLAAARRAVPELWLDEEGFAARILGQMPPKPANFLAIIGANLEPGEAARLEVGPNNCAAKAAWADALVPA